MKQLKKTGFVLLGIAMAISMAMISLCVYYEFFDPNLVVGINYVGEQIALDIKPVSEMTQEEIDEYEERWFMHAQYYDNSNNNGIEIQELKFNYFTDWTLLSDTYRSTGMQYEGDFETYSHSVNTEDEANFRVVEDFYYYDTTLGINWSGGKLATQLNREQQFVIRIEDRAFSIKLDKFEKVIYDYFLWKPLYITTFWDYGDVFSDAMKAIKETDVEYGSYYIELDLSEYFTIREYDLETGEFKADNVSDIIKNYAVLKYDYYPDGLLNANQSLFGMIQGDSTYGLDDETNTDYWQERVLYSLTEEDLSLRYSETYEGYFTSMPISMKTMLEQMDRVKIDIVINLDETNIVGLDLNAFSNVQLNSLTITSESDCNFYLLDNSLVGTELESLQHSANVNLVYSSNATSIELVEVII